MTPQTYQQQGA